MLHSVLLTATYERRRRTGVWKLGLVLVLMPIVAALAGWYAAPFDQLKWPTAPSADWVMSLIFTRTWGSVPQASVEKRPVGMGTGLPFRVCYSDESWQPPPVSLESQHLQAGARYEGLRGAERYAALMHDLGAPIDRVHVEMQPNTPGSALREFFELSGLWTDVGAVNPACPPASGTAELWSLQLRVQRFELLGGDLTAVASPVGAGVEVIQLSVPQQVQTLHVTDATGLSLTADHSLNR